MSAWAVARRFACGLLIAASTVAGGLPGEAARADDTAIGFVKSAAGNCSVRHGTAATPAHPGVPVHVDDVLETGPDGQLGVTFVDDTRISLGPRSRVVVPSFRFAPADQSYGFVIRVLSGTFEYISGLTAKLSPGAMSIETPTATIGVRGTRMVVRAED